MYKFTFEYTVGEPRVRYFLEKSQGFACAFMEGDHLINYTYEKVEIDYNILTKEDE